MSTRETTNAYRLNQWTQIIRECRSSGQKVNDWCRENEIDPKKYYYWLTKVRKAAAQALPATTNSLPIFPVQAVDTTPPIATDVTEVVATLSVGKVVVQLSNQASSELILNVIKAMQQC